MSPKQICLQCGSNYLLASLRTIFRIMSYKVIILFLFDRILSVYIHCVFFVMECRVFTHGCVMSLFSSIVSSRFSLWYRVSNYLKARIYLLRLFWQCSNNISPRLTYFFILETISKIILSFNSRCFYIYLLQFPALHMLPFIKNRPNMLL